MKKNKIKIDWANIDHCGTCSYEPIKKTNDKKEFFSNTFSDKFSENDIALNVLVYVITYIGWDGTVGTKTGNVTLLR
jgi:hypothetical protein